MKIYVRASKNRVMSTEYVSSSNADYLISDFETYARDLKRYVENHAEGFGDNNWTLEYYNVPEKDARTGEIRNISFALVYSYAGENVILVEMFYDPNSTPPMNVSVTCPILHKKKEFICKAYDFDSTNIEGLQTVDISPMMEKINEMVYNGTDISRWFMQ